MTLRPPRVLFVPGAGFGLGHLSRVSKLARALGQRATCMIATGMTDVCGLVPEHCEQVRVPRLNEMLAARTMNRLPDQDVRAEREAFFTDLERTFAPDVVVVDVMPVGLHGELLATLMQSSARKIFVMRPDVGTLVARVSIAAVGLSTLTRLYDAFLVASDPRISLVEEELRFGPSERSMTRAIGYVSLPVSTAEIETARRQRGLAAGDRWIVCSVGSGFFNRTLIEDCRRMAETFPEFHFDLVSGPSGQEGDTDGMAPPPTRGRLRAATVRTDLRILHAAADVVICHGGYNTITEAMEGGAAVIVDARSNPDHERAIHPGRLGPYYPITLVRESGDLERHLRTLATRGFVRYPVRSTGALDFDGCTAFARHILDATDGRCA